MPDKNNNNKEPDVEPEDRKKHGLEPQPDTIEPDEMYTPEDVEANDDNMNANPTDIAKGVPAGHTITGKAPEINAHKPKRHTPKGAKNQSDT